MNDFNKKCALLDSFKYMNKTFCKSNQFKTDLASYTVNYNN